MILDHCKEHESRTICIARMKTDIDNIKDTMKSRSEMMMRRAEIIEADIDKKLNTSTFYKIIGMLMVIVLATLGVVWSKLDSIDNSVNKITTNQAVIARVMDIHLDVSSED
jgi:hypothetical protein